MSSRASWHSEGVRPIAAPLWALAVFVAAVALFPEAARADDLGDFQRAREAYVRNEYESAVRLFEQLVGGPVPAIEDPFLVRESRKYLGAAYVLLGQRSRASDQFEALLRAEGATFTEYYLDPAEFPNEVLNVFGAVRERLVREARDAEGAARIRERRREQRRRDALVALVAMAEDASVTVAHDPAVAWIPFGAGQFQNGSPSLGTFFLVTEAVLLGASAALATVYLILLDQYEQSLTFRAPPVDPGALAGLQVANWLTAGAFGILAAAGVLEAHLNFVPSHRVRRRRDIPSDVLQNLELVIRPAWLGLEGRF